MNPSLPSALAAFGSAAKAKLANPAASGEPEAKAQWKKLLSLPNLLDADGLRVSSLSASTGVRCRNPWQFAFFSFLARVNARLCRLLRDEVTRQLALKGVSLTSLAADWRKLLFPEANDRTFPDRYTQSAAFGLRKARAKGIRVACDP
jgi:hypothetical protein